MRMNNDTVATAIAAIEFRIWWAEQQYDESKDRFYADMLVESAAAIADLTASQQAQANEWVPVKDGEWFWSEMDKTVLDISDDGKTITIDDGEHRLSKTFASVPIRLFKRAQGAPDAPQAAKEVDDEG